MIELLDAALSPVITDFAIDFDEKVVESITPNPKSMPYILKDEPVQLFLRFIHGFQGKTTVSIRYTDTLNKLPYESKLTLNTVTE